MSPKSRTRKRTKSTSNHQVSGHPANRAADPEGRGRPRPSRPMSVPLVAGVALLAALYQAMFAVRVLAAASGTKTVRGLLWDLSDSSWVFICILAGILAVGYIWVARGLMAGNREARTTAVWLSAIGVVFGLIELPFGAFALILSGASFFLLISFPVKDWFGVPRRSSK